MLFVKVDADALGYSRIGDTYYDDGFLRQLLRSCLDPSTKSATGRVSSAISRHYVDSGRTLTPLISMGRMTLFRLMRSMQPRVGEISRPGREILLSDGDFELFAVDATYKVLLSVKGQVKHGASKMGVALEGAGKSETHVVLTAGSKSGRLAASECAFSESDGPILSVLRKATMGHMDRIRILYTDNSAMFDTQLLRRELSSLEALSGDPMHRPFEVATFYGNSSKPDIVQIMKKYTSNS